jgi:hypothetical protein
MLQGFFIIMFTYDRDVGGQSLSDKQKNGTRRTNNLSGPLSLPTRASANSLSAPIRSSAGRIKPSIADLFCVCIIDLQAHSC